MKVGKRWSAVTGCAALFLASMAGAMAQTDGTDIEPTLPKSWVSAFQWRSIGPANMSGRISAITVSAKDSNTYWLASASGGLLKTVNNGITFEHQFDHEATVSIGDVQVAPSDDNVIWVGTGEHNPRNSVSWGNGVYKSVDGGTTWEHKGLDNIFQTGKIAIHPNDPSVVYVGAMGRLWGPNEDRGIFKTEDGGDTWKKILYIDENTGVIDIKMHPTDPYTLIAATYERARDGFDGNDPSKRWGPGGGLHKTIDGGETWTKLTDGLPDVEYGRIGFDYYLADPNVIFAVIETEVIGKEPENAPFAGLSGEDADVGARITSITDDSPAAKAELKEGDIILALEGETVHSYADFQKKMRAHLAGDTVGLEVSRERKSEFVEITFEQKPEPEETEEQAARRRRGRGGNRSPFGASLGGQRENMQGQQGPEEQNYGGIYKSIDGGDTWDRINSVNPRPMYYSEIRVDPSDSNYLWVLGTSLYKSSDGGETFTPDGAGRGVHVDNHAMWVDPADGRHVRLGCDGGHYVTYDRGENWEHLNKFAIGQFYHITVGPRRDYMVYGGLQDNGSWGGPNRGPDGGGPINADWFNIGGGDGFVCRVDPNDPDQLYSESQGGSMSRVNLRTGERGFIRPRAPRGERYRFNWKTPFILSAHNPKIHYSAGNHVFRSLKKGDGIKAISPDITNTEDGTGSAIAESPLNEDVLYVGTTDGALWATDNGGQSWRDIFNPTEEEEEAEESSGEGGEVAARRGGGGGGGGGMRDRLMQRDANGDGKLQKDELPERMQGMFDRLDANSDGAIDEEEMSAMARRGGGGGGGGRDGQRPPADAPATEESDPAPAAEEVAAEPAAEATPAAEEAQDEAATEGETEGEAAAATIEDVISGEWTGRLISGQIEGDQANFSFVLKMTPEGALTGTVRTFFSEGDIVDGKYDPEKGTLVFSADTGGMDMEFSGKLDDSKATGSIDVGGGAFQMDFEARLTKPGEGASGEAEADDGYDWAALSELVPGPRWVSMLEASRFEADRVYMTLDGHRSNDDEPYVFVSENRGKTWRSLRANLPTMAGSVRTMREDIANPNLLYLGCEFSTWVSIDRGASWTKFNSNLPTVAVHGIAIHPTAGEIVAGTHGRSAWATDVTALRQMSAETVAADAHLYTPNDGVIWQNSPRRGNSGLQSFAGENPSGGTAIYYSLGKRATSVKLEIRNVRGHTVRELEASTDAGLHRIGWNLRLPVPEGQQQQQRRRRFRRQGPLVQPGTYVVSLIVDGEEQLRELTVMTDPGHPAMDIAQINRQQFMEELMSVEGDED